MVTKTTLSLALALFAGMPAGAGASPAAAPGSPGAGPGSPPATTHGAVPAALAPAVPSREPITLPPGALRSPAGRQRPTLSAGSATGALPAALTRTVPFGEPVTVRTAVLRATAVVLAPDEEIRSLTLPDAERWQLDWSEYGPDGATVPVVTVTPTDCGLTTNLVLLTTRRAYSLLLDSPACDLAAAGFNPTLPFDALVRFRYPAGELTSEVPRRPAPPAARTVPMEAPLDVLLASASRFSWAKKKGYRGPLPVLVTDDGAATYVVFPEGAWKRRDLPLFFLVGEDGERHLANYDVEGSTFVVRTLFERAVLVPGGEKRRRRPHLLIRRDG